VRTVTGQVLWKNRMFAPREIYSGLNDFPTDMVRGLRAGQRQAVLR